jgi:hypothetical protein
MLKGSHDVPGAASCPAPGSVSASGLPSPGAGCQALSRSGESFPLP